MKTIKDEMGLLRMIKLMILMYKEKNVKNSVTLVFA